VLAQQRRADELELKNESYTAVCCSVWFGVPLATRRAALAAVQSVEEQPSNLVGMIAAARAGAHFIELCTRRIAQFTHLNEKPAHEQLSRRARVQ
jgi:hypothetical protein